MDRQHYDQAQQAQHHHLGDALQALLQAEGADQEARQYRQDHPEGHFAGVSKHGAEDAVNGIAFQAGKGAASELEEVAQHPAGDRGVVHHQQIAAGNAEPAVEMPFAALRLQGFIAQHRAFPAGTAHRQLHGQNGHAHQSQRQQVKQYEHAAAVGAGDVRKFPDISDADGTARADQQEAQPGLEVFTFHGESSLYSFSNGPQ